MCTFDGRKHGHRDVEVRESAPRACFATALHVELTQHGTELFSWHGRTKSHYQVHCPTTGNISPGGEGHPLPRGRSWDVGPRMQSGGIGRAGSGSSRPASAEAQGVPAPMPVGLLNRVQSLEARLEDLGREPCAFFVCFLCLFRFQVGMPFSRGEWQIVFEACAAYGSRRPARGFS
eukprot:s171_g3.t1